MSSRLLGGLPPAEAELIAPCLRRRTYPPGAILLAEGEHSTELYVVMSGRAEILALDAGGRPARVATAGAGATLGEMGLLTGRAASSTVRAVSEVDALVLDRARLEAIAPGCPEFMRRLSAIVAQRLTRATRRALGHPPTRFTRVFGPAEQAHGLAASLAWHTRAGVLLLALDDDPPFAGLRIGGFDAPPPRSLAGIATVATGPAPRPETEAWLAHLDDEGGWAHVLLYARRPPVHPDPADVLLDGPALTADDLRAVRAGTLAPRSPAGIALGRHARRVGRLRVGIAFGAGSVRGYAHVGVLRALERWGLVPDCLAGTSIGAGVAGLCALGFGPDDIQRVLDRAGRRALRLAPSTKALGSSAGLARMMRALAGETRIEELALPLGIVSADLVTGREIVFRSGTLWRAVLASSAIPGVYPAQRMGPLVLVDGGLLNPVPSTVAADLGADVVIGIRLGSTLPTSAESAESVLDDGPVPSVLKVMGRTIRVMQHHISLRVAEHATILIEPGIAPPARRRARAASHLRGYAVLGEAAAEAARDRVAAALPWMRALPDPA